MARIRAADVNAVRGIVTWVLRAVGVGVMSIGLYLTLKPILLAIAVGDTNMAHAVYSGVGESHPHTRGVAKLAVGGIHANGSVRLARWIVPVPPRGCPGCGYAGPGRDGICPECGLRIDGD
jgi:hypothetical protein